MNKLIVVIMGPGNKNFINMCVDSVKNADKILYYTSSPEKVEKQIDDLEAYKTNKIEVFYNSWNEKDKSTNAKSRNLYLSHLKKEYPDDWCLVIDEDEILEDISKIYKFINLATPGLYSVKMRHLIGNLGWEDATNPVHFVPHRLFKISEAAEYPLHSHPVLLPVSNEVTCANCQVTTIWHLGHLPVEYMDYILKRYKQHSNDSVIHTQDFLHKWKMSHLLGMYPIRQVNPLDLPKQLLERYEIDKDEFYFINRGVEVKHFIMVKQWLDYFKNKEVLDCGCGRGPYMFAWNMYGVKANGFDISKYAVTHSLLGNGNIWIGNVLEEPISLKFELVTAIDLLEHLKYDDLDLALKNISKMTKKNVLFSIPFIGDPNLENDNTHVIKETKDWWLDKLEEYFIIEDAPKNWLFGEQLLIGRKK